MCFGNITRYGPSQRESARFYANWPESALSQRESGNGKKKKLDAAPTDRQRRRLHVAMLDTGVAAILLRPCFSGCDTMVFMEQTECNSFLPSCSSNLQHMQFGGVYSSGISVGARRS